MGKKLHFRLLLEKTSESQGFNLQPQKESAIAVAAPAYS